MALHHQNSNYDLTLDSNSQNIPDSHLKDPMGTTPGGENGIRGRLTIVEREIQSRSPVSFTSLWSSPLNKDPPFCDDDAATTTAVRCAALSGGSGGGTASSRARLSDRRDGRERSASYRLSGRLVRRRGRSTASNSFRRMR